MKAEKLYAQFRARSIPSRGGLLLLTATDALELLEEAADEGVPVLGVDGMRVTAQATESPLEHAADYSARVAEGHGCWVEAEAFIRERATQGLAFEVTLGDDPLEVV
jgi:pyruvate kinase